MFLARRVYAVGALYERILAQELGMALREGTIPLWRGKLVELLP